MSSSPHTLESLRLLHCDQNLFCWEKILGQWRRKQRELLVGMRTWLATEFQRCYLRKLEIIVSVLSGAYIYLFQLSIMLRTAIAMHAWYPLLQSSEDRTPFKIKTSVCYLLLPTRTIRTNEDCYITDIGWKRYLIYVPSTTVMFAENTKKSKIRPNPRFHRDPRSDWMFRPPVSSAECAVPCAVHILPVHSIPYLSSFFTTCDYVNTTRLRNFTSTLLRLWH